MPSELERNMKEAIEALKVKIESEPEKRQLEGTEFETELVRLRLKERALKLELTSVQAQIDRLTQ